MNKAGLIATLAKNRRMPKTDAAAIVECLLACIVAAMKKGEVVRLVGFGTFSVGRRKASLGRDPRTGAKIAVAATRRPRFRAGKNLRAAVN